MIELDWKHSQHKHPQEKKVLVSVPCPEVIKKLMSFMFHSVCCVLCVKWIDRQSSLSASTYAYCDANCIYRHTDCVVTTVKNMSVKTHSVTSGFITGGQQRHSHDSFILSLSVKQTDACQTLHNVTVKSPTRCDWTTSHHAPPLLQYSSQLSLPCVSTTAESMHRTKYIWLNMQKWCVEAQLLVGIGQSSLPRMY